MFRLVVPPCYVPEGDSPLSLYATVLSSKVVLASVSRHRAGVRATVPAVQVCGECSYGTCRSSQQEEEEEEGSLLTRNEDLSVGTHNTRIETQAICYPLRRQVQRTTMLRPLFEMGNA